MNRAGFLLVLALSTAGFSIRGYALATEQIGPDPADRPTVAQPGWPSGIVELTRHSSRVYSVWVNGNEQFYFEAAPQKVNELLALFGQARMRDHAVRVLPGSGTVNSFDRRSIGYNVSLQVLTGIALAHAREQPQPWGGAGVQLEPTLTIHSGEGDDLLRQLSWPTNAIIDCQVPGVSIESPKTRPIRNRFHGRLVFADGSPAEGFVRNVATRITLWDGGDQPGIGLTEADRDGRFTVGFSPKEIADLQAGRTWLTVTIGNWLTAPRPMDQRLPFDRLAPDSDQAKPLEISGPPTYYGRILFENGEPPVLKPEPWPGARGR